MDDYFWEEYIFEGTEALTAKNGRAVNPPKVASSWSTLLTLHLFSNKCRSLRSVLLLPLRVCLPFENLMYLCKRVGFFPTWWKLLLFIFPSASFKNVSLYYAFKMDKWKDPHMYFFLTVEVYFYPIPSRHVVSFLNYSQRHIKVFLNISIFRAQYEPLLPSSVCLNVPTSARICSIFKSSRTLKNFKAANIHRCKNIWNKPLELLFGK